MIELLGYLSCRQASSFAILDCMRDVLLREEVTKKLCVCDEKPPGVANTTKEERMKRTWTTDELLEHFTLLPDEFVAVGNKSGATRLGFAVLLKCLQYDGRFPRSRQEAAPEVVRFLATQVGVDATLFAQYAWEVPPRR